MTVSNDKQYENAEAAAYIGVSPTTLTTWRSTHRYCIPFYKVGRCVRYRQSDLDAWLETRKVTQ